MKFMRFSVLVAVLTFYGTGVFGDVVLLQNGDRISGTVISVVDGTLAVETDYAGTLSIAMDAVARMESDAPVVVKMMEDQLMEGTLSEQNAAMGIKTEDTWQPVATGDITALARDREAFDRLLAAMEPKRWSGTVDAGAALRSGNTDTTDLKLAVTFERAGDRNTLALKLAALYGEADGTLNTRRYSGEFRWEYHLRDRLYLYTLGLAERDDGRKLDLRLQGGAGVGYEILQRERTTLSADLGLTYTNERWAPFTPWERDALKAATRGAAFGRLYGLLPDLYDNGLLFTGTVEELQGILADIRTPLGSYSRRSENYPNLRLGFQFTQALFKDSMLSEDLVLLPNLEEMGEFRALSELAFTTPVTESVSLRTSLKSEYDSLADKKGVEEWDHTFMTEVRYSF